MLPSQRTEPVLHPHRHERQDDRDHEHGCRGAPRARRRAPLRARARRHPPRRLRHTHGRDGTARSATFTPASSGNDETWRDQIVAAGEASGDHAWPWPMHRRYRGLIQSAFADMKNSSVRGRRSRPTRVVPRGVRRRGPVGARRHRRHRLPHAGARRLSSQKGGTGYGVRLIAELASSSPRELRPLRRAGARPRTVREFAESGSRRSPRSSTASTASRTSSSPSSPSSG